jgi:hypothetical protein
VQIQGHKLHTSDQLVGVAATVPVVAVTEPAALPSTAVVVVVGIALVVWPFDTEVPVEVETESPVPPAVAAALPSV